MIKTILKKIKRKFYIIFENCLKKNHSLKNNIKKMIFKTLKRVEDRLLNHYLIEINFSTIDYLNNYKLPIICNVVDFNEALLIQQNIIKGLLNNNFNITSINQPKEILDLKNTKKIIINNQQINGFNNIKIILEKIKFENGYYTRYTEGDEDKLTFKVNIIGKEATPFSLIEDLFVVGLDKNKLEDS